MWGRGMKKKRIVITGLGVINPLGNTIESFWEKLSKGESKVRKISRFSTNGYPIKVAGEVEDFEVNNYVSKRIANKTDLFTHYILAAAKQALNDAKIPDVQENSRLGIFYGNNSGGWEICERGFAELYQKGVDMVNPWQATAWFPTAAQGYTSIIHKIKGYSKTFVADKVSSASAIEFGIKSIVMGRNDAVLVGGTEAPLTPLGTICYFENGEMSGEEDCKTASMPFHPQSKGMVLGEGAAAFIMEELENATKRNAKIYGEITGYSTNTGLTDKEEHLKNCMLAAIQDAGLTTEDIDLVIPEGNGCYQSDQVEQAALTSIFKNKEKKTAILFPKYYFGHLYGASAATDVLCGIGAIRNMPLPTYLYMEHISECFTVEMQGKSIRHVLINSRTTEGINYSMIISKY